MKRFEKLWLKKLKKEAERGDSDAQNNLGFYYYNGIYTTPDYEQAVYWYKKSAEQGNSYAQYNLGYCYYNGEGVEQDYQQAVYFLTQAAEQGNLSMLLGYCYFAGHGVKQDYAQAVYWYTRAFEGLLTVTFMVHTDHNAMRMIAKPKNNTSV